MPQREKHKRIRQKTSIETKMIEHVKNVLLFLLFIFKITGMYIC